RKAILEVHAKGMSLAKEVTLETVAKGTPGFSGADLASLINEAAILAARRNRKDISLKELEDAADRVIAGPEKKSRVIIQKEKEIIAYHESGHALTARMLPNADPVHKVSIIARGVMGGEKRVAAIPSTCKKYVEMGITVLVEKSAGEGALFGNEEYRIAGAEIMDDVEALYDRANVILKVKEPLYNHEKNKHEIDMMKENTVLISFLHPASPTNHEMVKKIRDRKIISFTMDSIPRITRAQKMDALTSMSTVAGYKSAIMAAN
ncbi:unnamed protein product, partial [marine sediment metagenome]